MWFFAILIFFSKVVQKSDRYWVHAQVCTASMLSKSEKIVMSLNSMQKSFCQLATTELFPKKQRIGKQLENDKSAFGSLSRVCYASTTTHYDKTVVLWHAIARGSDIVTEQERSLAISTRPRPSHAVRKDKSVRTAAFQARRYYSESDWDEFKSVAVRIWLLRK